VIKDVFSNEQKRQIISRLTDAMVSIEGENMRQVTLCLVEEDSGDWGIKAMNHRRRPRSGAWRVVRAPHGAIRSRAVTQP
jgi:4-oxalocrotonate tautomerase family enzyme